MAAEASASTGAALRARLCEKVNPVLVKEVRAALRGRTFAIGFVVVLALAFVGSLIALIAGDSAASGTGGGFYLGAVTGVFALGAYGLVPFSAMASMNAEHDDGAIEQLQLSGLSTDQIVFGKLGGALVLAALIYAAFLPFLAFATLLPGVDLLGVLSGVAGSFAGTITFSAVGILIGASLRRRAARVFGYVILAIVLIVGIQVLTGLTLALSMSGTAGAPVISQFAGILILSGVITAICSVQAAARLAHPEENRSGGFRIVGTASTLVIGAFALTADTPATMFAILIVALLAGFPALTIAVAERERFPRAVLARALRGRGSHWIFTPWLPGGGRGVALVLLHAALVLALALAAALRLRPADALPHVVALACVTLYTATALLLPSGIFARWMDRGWAQILARIAILGLPLAALLVPSLLRFLTGATGGEFRHVGNPAHLALDVLDEGRIDDRLGLAILIAVFVLALALNAPRVVRSLLELPRERARRAAAQPSQPAVAAAPHAEPQP